MNQNKTNIVLAVLFIFSLLCSCNPEPQLTNNIAASPCNPPCWQNITPGESTIEDVQNRIPFIDIKHVVWIGSFDKYSEYVWWNFTNPSQYGWIGFNGNVVGDIQISGNINLNLEQAVSKYGTPAKYVYGLYSDGDLFFVKVSILYPEKGLIISFRNKNTRIVEILSNQEIDLLIFVDPKSYEDYLITILRPIIYEEDFKERSRIWNGYTTIETGYP